MPSVHCLGRKTGCCYLWGVRSVGRGHRDMNGAGGGEQGMSKRALRLINPRTEGPGLKTSQLEVLGKVLQVGFENRLKN